MFIDAHCHLNQNSQIDKIDKLINIGVDINSSLQVIESCKNNDKIYGSIGVHPLYLDNNLCIEWLVENSKNHNIIAFGETGLDLYKANNLNEQLISFNKHIEASNITNLPLIIHTRNADQEIIEILPKIKKAVLHSFTGSQKLAYKALEYNVYISFSGIITFKNVEYLIDIVKNTPLNRILIETDAPYLTPVPFRGKENHPNYIIHTYKKIAEILNIDIKTLQDHVKANFLNLFSSASF